MTPYLRSALFLVWFVIVSAVFNVGSLPLLLFPRWGAVWAANGWARSVLFGLKHIAGLGLEIRGQVPEGPALVAAKHFSMWETIAVLAVFNDPAIVLKHTLLLIPLYGWYCIKQGMIPIDRSGGARAIRRMNAAARRAMSLGRPIVIFPEGTRRKLGAPPDYKPGVAGIYSLLGLSCVPMAHNSGLFWSSWFLRKPGTIVVEFLEPIPPGLQRREFMRMLETKIEEGSNRLVAEGRRVSSMGATAGSDVFT
jgi:1-acyl-sn-glycerol-3-phosphate acyltransferase